VNDEDLARKLADELPRLMRLAERIAPPGVAPEDLLQDVVERAWRARGSFRGQARASTWLHRILVNRAADLARRARSQAHSAGSSEQAELSAQTDEPTTRARTRRSSTPWADELADPALLVERAEDRRMLRRALTRLPLQERTVLALYDGEGMSAGEVAALLGTSPAAIHKRVQRARWRLAAELSAGAPAGAARPPSACHRALAAASDYIDGTLVEETRARVEEHLRVCERCPPLVQALVGLRLALRATGSAELAPEVRLALLASVKAPGEA
jgi:RNA polymerase sigma factor (sigma-70 family)